MIRRKIECSNLFLISGLEPGRTLLLSALFGHGVYTQKPSVASECAGSYGVSTENIQRHHRECQCYIWDPNSECFCWVLWVKCTNLIFFCNHFLLFKKSYQTDKTEQFINVIYRLTEMLFSHLIHFEKCSEWKFKGRTLLILRRVPIQEIPYILVQ